MKRTIILVLTNICIMTSLGQNRQKADILSLDYLDSLCTAMSKEYRTNTHTNIDGKSPIEITGHWFSKYMYWEYDNKPPRTTVFEKQLKEGTLLRLAEGNFRWETLDSYGKPYNCPTEMKEVEFFFLNGILVKISFIEGTTDYNFIPAKYWIRTDYLNLLFQENKIVRKSCGSPYKEWLEHYMKHFNVDENELIQKAHTLYTSAK